MDRFAPQLAGERLAAFAAGVHARRAGRPISDNPFADNILRSSQAHEWRDGWTWQDGQERAVAGS